jgi:hypothetical protein
MTTNIEKIILKKGPMLSSKLIKELRDVSSGAARKRIERSGLRRAPVTLPHNDSFLYTESQFGTYSYFEAIENSLKESGSALGVALSSIEAHGGVVTVNSFPAISGSPKLLKKHLSYQRVLDSLETLELIYRVKISSGELLCLRKNSVNKALPAYHAQMVVEKVFLMHLSEWLRKTGLSSWGKTEIRNLKKMPRFGPFEWDLCGPSYIHPFKQYNKKKLHPGFVVADVLFGKKVDKAEVEFFVRKCATIRQNPKMKPFLSILVSEEFSKDAFEYGQKLGLLFVTPGTLFGNDVKKGLSKLLEVLTHPGAYAARGLKHIEEIFSSMAKIEGAALNIRGPLFELIVGHAVYIGEGGSIDIGKVINNLNVPKGVIEIDVFLVKGRDSSPHEVKVYECKGKLAGVEVTKDEVEKWVEKRIPVIHKWLLSQPRFSTSPYSFEFWTTSEFSSDANKYLKKVSQKTKKYKIVWKNGKEVLEYLKAIKAKPLVQTLNEHYLKHPFSK